MRYLNSVYIRDYQARVGYRRGSLLVAKPDGKQRIPIQTLDAVILFGGQITTEALTQLVNHNIRVAALTRGGKSRFTVNRPLSGNVHLRQAQHQAAADPARTLDITRNIVAAKLQNSRRVIARWGRDHTNTSVRTELRDRADQIGERISRTAVAETPHSLRGVEGDAARLHFGAMRILLSHGPLPFTARMRRPPRDPVNALLGMCYGMVLTEVAGAVETVGLDPQIGFMHRARSGRASLALDLMEELRPIVDRFIVGAARRRQMQPDDFTTTPGGACYLSDGGRDKLLKLWEQHKSTTLQHKIVGRQVERWAIPTIQATLLARHLRGDLPGYPPFVLSR